jgi:hypothetical protein
MYLCISLLLICVKIHVLAILFSLTLILAACPSYSILLDVISLTERPGYPITTEFIILILLGYEVQTITLLLM